MSSLIDTADARWFRFLSRWALLAGLVDSIRLTKIA